jgi:hypothetical protein
MDNITTVLFNRGCLVDLYIGRPTGTKKMSANDVLLEDINEQVILLGHKKLLPKSALEPFVKIEGQARMALAKKSIPFPVGKASFVFYKTLTSLKDELDSLKEDWEKALTHLETYYSELREAQIALLDNQAKQIAYNKLDAYQGRDNYKEKEDELSEWFHRQWSSHRAVFPKVEELRGKFSFRYSVFKVSAVEGFEELDNQEQDELLAAKQQVEKEIQQWTKEAMAAVHNALGVAAANARNLLVKQGKLNPKNLKPLFEAFETFKAIDFTGSSDFQETIAKIQELCVVKQADGSIDYQATATEVTDSVQEFDKLLSTVGSLAVDEVASVAGINAINKIGEFRRYIEI